MAFQVFTVLSTWTWPAGVTSVVIQALGGGGRGGVASGNPATGGGGKGGSFVTLTVTKGAESALQIEPGETGSPDTLVRRSGTGVVLVVASAGSPGNGASAANENGAGATTLWGSPIPAITWEGGNGGTGNFTSGVGGSGAGGGAAGPTGVGSAASGNTAGIGNTGLWADGLAHGGNGAAGVGNSTNGATGVNYGGGGSGGKANNNPDRTGGIGGGGLVVLSWTAVTPTQQPMVTIS